MLQTCSKGLTRPYFGSPGGFELLGVALLKLGAPVLELAVPVAGAFEVPRSSGEGGGGGGGGGGPGVALPGGARGGGTGSAFPTALIRATRPPWCIPFGRPIPHRVGKHGLRSPQGIVKSTKTKLDVHQFHLIVKLHKGRNYLTWIPLTLSLAWTTLEQRKNQRKNQRTHNIDDACTVDILLNLTLRFGIQFKTEWLYMLPQILDIKAKPHHNDQKSKNLQKVQEYPVIYIYLFI